MTGLPRTSAEKGVKFTAADFYEAGRERLALSVVAGAGNMDRVIREPIVNRCGLALTGFFMSFAHERLQIVGNAERMYLNTIGDDKRVEVFRQMTAHKAWIFVMTQGHKPSKRIVEYAETHGAVIFSTKLTTRLFTRLAGFLLERLGAPRTSIYGTMVEVYGLGVLFEGDPGLGKSETALGLLKGGHALIADDLTCIRKDVGSNALFGSASEATSGYMEIRGIGIMYVPGVFGVNAIRSEKRLDLVITLRKMSEMRGEIDRVGQTRKSRTILGVDIPNIIIPVSEGRDLVNLVETAVQQQKLVAAGYNAAMELSEHLRRRAGHKVI
ncbi:MAG: HPr(Ser) kinase/phosphatase [Kiritimatiellae bacterium]|nr:HPr(Ser) kinase/phosphatase [Kiritimatiellia bacterium]